MANAQEYGVFVNTTYVWDVAQLNQIDVTSPEFKELLVRMYQNINAISLALNIKDSGYYVTQEFVNGQLWFPNPALNSGTATAPQFRQVYREVVNFGMLPNNTFKTVAHNIPINSGYSFTRIYAAASDQVALKYVPIPYASASGTDDIQLDVTSTSVKITTASNRTNYTVCYVILEYIKN